MKLPHSFSQVAMLPLSILALSATQISSHAQTPIENPVPESVADGFVVLPIKEYSRIPQSSGGGTGWARINHLKPDGMGRLFVNDLRGLMHLVSENEADVYLDLASEVGNAFADSPGLGTGFTSFAFHPEFDSNGKFYTSHSESAGAATADFTTFAGDIRLQGVVTEWTATDPTASTFIGEQKELLRVDLTGTIHGMQEISFNTAASSSSADYGNLYICIGDAGSTIAGFPENTARLDSLLGTILRIDPLGDNSDNGQYGIPDDNPFATDNDDDTFGEIYAYGFRNPHRISWDAADETKMYEGEIGERSIEEVNLIESGLNYGWNTREGTFVINEDWVNNPGAGENDEIFALPDNDDELGFTYPVGMLDRDEARSLIGGYVYRGSSFPDFQGQYIFGDLFTGFFNIDAESVTQNTQSVITRVFVRYEGRIYESLRDVTDAGVGSRDPDFRFGYDENNELFLLSKHNGRIYQVAADEPDVPEDSSLINISTRGKVGTGNAVMIGGFVIPNNQSVTVLIQGVGSELSTTSPSLEGRLLSDVEIALYDSNGVELLSNDDWESDDAALKSMAMNSVGSVVLESGSTSSSIVTELSGGAYTVILTGVDGEEGVALIEVYKVEGLSIDNSN